MRRRVAIGKDHSLTGQHHQGIRAVGGWPERLGIQRYVDDSRRRRNHPDNEASARTNVPPSENRTVEDIGVGDE